MKNNKLIGDFIAPLGLRTRDGGYMPENEMRYDTSWDWLMPVVQKCFDTQQPEEGQHYFINESLLTMDIGVVYDRVVEFIKTFNEK